MRLTQFSISHMSDFVFLLDENAIHIGGVKVTNDPRFTDYDHFDGCISSTWTLINYSFLSGERSCSVTLSSFPQHQKTDVVVELDGTQLHPLLAYLGYQRSGLEAVTSHDPEGKC